MNVRTQIIVAVLILFALIVIINRIRKNSLELRYAMAWLFALAGILIFDIFPGIMTACAEFMGIATPTNMLFFMGFCFLLMIVFGLTAAVSRMSVQIKKLTQEMALLEKRLREKEEKN